MVRERSIHARSSIITLEKLTSFKLISLSRIVPRSDEGWTETILSNYRSFLGSASPRVLRM